jgi:hypothetical protein
MIENLKNNRAFQTIVGAFTIWMTWCLYRDGWISWVFNKEYQSADGGFGNSALWISIGAAVLNFVQMVGIFTIAVVGGILPHVDDILKMFVKWINGLTASLKKYIENWKKAEKTDSDGKFNWKPFIAVIIGWFLWINGALDSVKDRVIDVIPVVIDGQVENLPVGKSAAVIFSVTPNITANQNLVTLSGKLDQWMEANKIERRRILSTASTMSSETWVTEAMVEAPDDKDCLVVFSNGEVSVHPIPDSVEETMEFLRNYNWEQ